MIEGPHSAVFLAELDGLPVGAGLVHVTHRTAWLRGGTVVPEARGHGIQRALIEHRALFAVAEKCDVAGATAEPGSVSAANLRRMGFEAVGTRERHRWPSEER
jgi:GNAT superfamily N-acetyltransferase